MLEQKQPSSVALLNMCSFNIWINYTTELSCRVPLAIGEVFGELISSIEYDQSG